MTLLKDIPIELNREEVLRYLGYKRNKMVINNSLAQIIEEMVENSSTFLNPRGIFDTLVVEHFDRERIVFKDTRFCLEGIQISRYFSKCSRVTFIAATVGEEIDSEIEKLFEAGDSTRAVILDAIGSDAVEQAVNWINNFIQKQAGNKGYFTLSRVSPGYGLWPIEANLEIAKFLNTRTIGLRVLESYQLVPRKSVIAAVGWIPRKLPAEIKGGRP